MAGNQQKRKNDMAIQFENDTRTLVCDECGKEAYYYGSALSTLEDSKDDGWEYVYDEELKEWYVNCGCLSD